MIPCVLALLVGQAQAYELSGRSWLWQENPIEEPFQLNLSTFPSSYLRSEVEDGYIAAFPIWNGQSRSGFQIAYGGQTSVTQVGGGPDGTNMAKWAASSPDGAVALSTRIFLDADIVECDIQFFGSNTGGPVNWSFDAVEGAGPDEYNFIYTATHELGHCLGLSHSADSSAVMRPVQSKGLGADSWDLAPDDVAGIQAIYGVVEPDLQLSVTATPPDIEDPDASPGSVFELAVGVDNVGGGTAYDVQGLATVTGGELWLALPNNSAEMGDVIAGQTNGTLESNLTFNLIVPPDCVNGGTSTVAVAVSDASGAVWDAFIDLEIACPEVESEYVDDLGGTWSPGCSAAGPNPVKWWFALPLLMWRRRL